MANSSASPNNLETFVTQGGQANQNLETAIGAANGPVQAFLDAPCDGRFRPAGLDNAMSQARQYHTDNATDEQWIAGIRQAFIEADSSTLPDASIAASLSRQGISAGAPPAMTVDEPVYHPATMYSGWNDDPVSTAAGGFWHTEQDLAMPPALAVLSWPRTYNSRSRSGGPQGAGWSSWASARLDVTDLAVTYHGPDGQLADFLADGGDEGGFQSPLGVPATLRATGEGFVLAWRWTAQYPAASWSFDLAGQLLAVEDPNGGRTDFERDENGRLLAVRHEAGRSVTLHWESGRVMGLRSSDGREVRYEWDGDRLVGVEKPEGAMRYQLDDTGRVGALEDADGVVLVRNTYDDEGRVVEQVSPFGRVTRYQYFVPHTVLVEGNDDNPAALFRHDEQGHLVELQVAGKLRWSRQFDERGNPVRVVGPDGTVTSRRFDVDGNCVGERQSGPAGAGMERTWDHDRRGRVTSMTSPDGQTLRFGYEGEGPRPSVIEGPLGLRMEIVSEPGLVRMTDPDGVTTTYELDGERQITAVTDGLGNTTRYTYHPSGLLASVTFPNGDVQRWEYDETGRAVASVAPGGGRSTRRYSAAGRLLDQTSPEGATTSWTIGPEGEPVAAQGPGGADLSFVWDQGGFLTSMSGPTGATWRYNWDEAGRLTTFTDGNGATWTQLWDNDGHRAGYADPLGREQRIASNAADRPVSVRSAAGRSYELRWDRAGRLVGATSPEGPSSCEIRYDVLGRPSEWVVDGVARSRAVYTDGGRLASLASLDGSVWRFSYDAAGRLSRSEGPDGVDRITRDSLGRIVRIAAGDGVVTEWHYGPDGNLAEVRSGASVRRLRYDRDRLLVEEELTGRGTRRWERGRGGLVTAVHDAAGGVTRFERDWRGQVVAWAGAHGARWSAEADAEGRPLAVTDPLGRRSAWELDPTGQAVALSLPDGTRRTYQRDADGNLLSLAAVDSAGASLALLDVFPDWDGRAMTLRDPLTGEIRLRWDGLGRVVELTSAEGTTLWDFDDANRRVVVTRPDGSATSQVSGPSGAVETFEHPRAGLVTVERDPTGRPVALTAAGLSRRWERDEAGRVRAYHEEVAGTSRRAVIERDSVGRALRVVENGPEGEAVWTYAYDGAGQLVEAAGPDGDWTWEHDLSGRLVAEQGPEGSRRFHYDAADQLTAVESPEGTTTVTYDPLGRRVAEDGPAGGVRYEWDLQDRLVAVQRDAGGETRRTELVYDALGRPVRVGDEQLRWELGGPLGPRPAALGDAELVELPGLPLATVEGDEVRWLSADWRGNLAARDPWGAPLGPTSFRSGHPAPVALGFLGEVEVDGLVWLRARVYDPATHAFLTRDPLAGLPGGPGTATNPYLYAGNDPLQMVDPLGRKPLTAAEADQQMQSWKQGHWKEALVTAAAVAGTALIVALAPEALPVLIPAVIGAATSGGGVVVSDLVRHQPIQWDQVVTAAAVGGFAGAAAGPLGSKLVPEGTSALRAFVTDAAMGGVSNTATTSTEDWADNNPITWQGELLSFGTGAAGGAAGRALRAPEEFPEKPTDLTWRDTTNLTPQQLAARDSDNPFVSIPAKIAHPIEPLRATVVAKGINFRNTVSNNFYSAVGKFNKNVTNPTTSSLTSGGATIGNDVAQPSSAGPTTPSTPATGHPQVPFPTMPTPAPVP